MEENATQEEATQQATQLVVDPRRLGQGNSGMDDKDLADIICILHPHTSPAIQAASQLYKTNPEYTLPNEHNVHIREKNSIDIENEENLPPDTVACDIALRLSANLKDPAGGFHFGRNPQRCDVVLGRYDEAKRVSNVHFRIYVNEHGVIMLEDQSTNGTAVDGNLLRAKEKENNRDYRHTLGQGSVIVLTMTPPAEDYRFTVRIPQRESHVEDAYERNLTAYFRRVMHARMEIDQRIATAGDKKRQPVNLFPTHGAATPNPGSLSSVGKRIREWKGGNKYNKVGCVGKGAFATVYMLTAKFDGTPYAAKELEKRRFMKNGILDQKVDMEMKIMRKIKHPNVVQYIEHVDWDDYLYIIMEYIPGGDLGSRIGHHGCLSELNVKMMAGQLLSALKYLHEGGITHRDVKPDNILISSMDPFHVKLTDFGLSKMIDSEETFLRTFCGTLLYCAPEVYSEYREYDQAGTKRNMRGVDRRTLPPQRYGHAVDIWSLGGVLFYALCGSPPYPVKNGTSYQELLNRIMSQALDIRPLQRANISESGIRFVRSMLHTDPEARAAIEDLEQSSWFVGGDSLEVSMEEDEVDLVGDGFIDPELEEGTSQLSIHNQDNLQVNESEEIYDNGSDVTEIQQPEIPNSFSTGDDTSIEMPSHEFTQHQVQSGNGRLFGEVNISNIGSSGAIPMSQLNLLIPSRELYFNESSEEGSRYTHSELGPESSRKEAATKRAESVPKITMAPPPLPSVKPQNLDARAIRSSSLMGTESMVGNLNMQSPLSAASPGADSPAAIEHVREPASSLRRPREEDIDEGGSWRPSDLPSKRRRKSAREIEMDVPPSIFWDPKDKSTHHNNYPRMSTSDFNAFQDYAKKKGEEFRPGFQTFENTMQSFRSSRSPSIEPETRAQSEPAKEEGGRLYMKRDQRRLLDELHHAEHSRLPAPPPVDENLPNTAGPSIIPTPDDTTAIGPNTSPQPVVGNDFQLPKRILAKLVATSDSCLPTIAMNITESVTSWGRGFEATVRMMNGHELRVPKYAFKIILFKPSFYSIPHLANEKWASDMQFFISTKASVGIWINSTKLESSDPQNPKTKSKFWGELRHGDLITVWRDFKNKESFTRLRFECYWGQSRNIRQRGEGFKLVGDGPFLKELENVCMSEEGVILVENARRRAEENRIAHEEKQRMKSIREAAAQSSSFDFDHPFSDAPSTST